MIEKMKFVSLKCDKENLDDILVKTMKNCYISPIEASLICNEENSGNVLMISNPYSEYLNSLNTIAHSIGIKLISCQETNKSYTNSEIEAFIRELEEKVDLSLKDEDLKLTEDDRKALDELSKLGFERLHKTNFIHVGLGRLSLDSYKKLIIMDDLPFDLAILHSNKQYHWVCYVCSKSDASETLKILDGLFLENIRIPDIDVKQLINDYSERINDIYTFCYVNNKIRSLYEYVAVIGNKYIISGFVPSKKQKEFVDYYKGDRVDFRFKEPYDRPDIKAPTLLKNNWFFKPFEAFVEMYSMPDYYDFDPTIILGIMYCLLFGIMFGDLGQGFILTLLGFFINKKKPSKIAGIISRVGIFSMFFGFLYGSFFGNEEILIPIHQMLFGVEHKLVHVMDESFTMKLLTIAVVIGMLSILFAMILNVYKYYRHKNYGEVFFSPNGLAGFMMYLFFFVNVIDLMVLNGKGFLSVPYLVIFIAFPLLIIYFKHPLTNLIENKEIRPHEGWPAYLIQGIFELLEVMLSFISNTMSYLRVGGFVLSHAGMMLVVMTVSGMVGGAGSLLVIIFGNIFVIGLEGLIVGIQTLRLQYYEMFSRYYDGGGKKFEVFTMEH